MIGSFLNLAPPLVSCLLLLLLLSVLRTEHLRAFLLRAAFCSGSAYA